jgi:hypothetical protein
MKTNSSRNNIQNKAEIIHSKLDQIDCNKIALEAGFSQRASRKISPKNLLLGFFLMVFSSCANSYENWAIKIGLLSRQTVSKQAVQLRIKKDPREYLKKLLEELINRTAFSQAIAEQILKGFKNVYIQDSTTAKLDRRLFKYYPGNENKFPKIKKSVLKIQAVYNITKRSFKYFELTSFRENDQKKSPDILSIVKEGDLILRDLGYSVLNVFKRMIDLKIFFISRLKYAVSLYDAKTKERINLLKLLKKKNFLDIDVLIGSRQKIPVRLVALRLDKRLANRRRRLARKDRDRRKNHSKEYYELLGWKILITNVDRQRLSIIEIVEIYSLRFRIEVIFKCWKSYFKLTEVEECRNRLRVETYIYSMLIFIVLFQTCFYRFIETKAEEPSEVNKDCIKKISMMKLMKFIADNIHILILSEVLGMAIPQNFFDLIVYHCSYQPRGGRKNFSEKLLKLT